MLRATGKSLGKWTIAAILLAAVAAFAVPGAATAHFSALKAPTPVGPAGHAPPLAPCAPAIVAPHPAVRPLQVTASAAITSSYSGTQTIPVGVDWTINVTGASVDASNVSMSLLIMNGVNEIA